MQISCHTAGIALERSQQKCRLEREARYRRKLLHTMTTIYANLVCSWDRTHDHSMVTCGNNALTVCAKFIWTIGQMCCEDDWQSKHNQICVGKKGMHEYRRIELPLKFRSRCRQMLGHNFIIKTASASHTDRSPRHNPAYPWRHRAQWTNHCAISGNSMNVSYVSKCSACKRNGGLLIPKVIRRHGNETHQRHKTFTVLDLCSCKVSCQNSALSLLGL